MGEHAERAPPRSATRSICYLTIGIVDNNVTHTNTVGRSRIARSPDENLDDNTVLYETRRDLSDRAPGTSDVDHPFGRAMSTS